MLPPVSPIRDSMSGGPSTSWSSRQSPRSGAKRDDQVDELLRHPVAPRVPVAVGDLVGRVLAEDAQQVLALRRRARVIAGLDVDLAEGDGGLAGRAALERRLRLVHRAGGVDVARAGQSAPGAAVQFGSRSSAGVELDHRAADLPGARAARGSRRRSRRRRASRASASGRRCRSRSAPAERCRPRASLPRRGRSRRPATPQASTAPASAAASAIAKLHHPHAALDVAPDRPLAVEVSLVVHELDRGGAVVVRAAPGADDPLAEQRRLQRARRRCRSSSTSAIEASKQRSIISCVAAEQVLDLVAGRACRRPRCRARPCAAACGRRRTAPRRPSSRRCRLAETPSSSRFASVFASSSHWPNAVPSSNGTQRFGSAIQ